MSAPERSRARSSGARPSARPGRAPVAIALLALYVIWGSTYFAIRVALEGIPPLLMAGSRFLVAGAALYAMARASGDAPPTAAEWRGGGGGGGRARAPPARPPPP